MTLSLPQIEAAVKAKGYSWFSQGEYNLNIVGVRNSATGTRITNGFDDLITLSYQIGGVWQHHQYKATTDPGIKSAQNLMNQKGVAVLVPGQYSGSHQIGLHQGKYEALTQRRPVKVYRDRNRDLKYDLDPSKIDEGLFGINIHRASATGTSTLVDGWSAGCQVFASNGDFSHFMNVIRHARTRWGNTFTYTLIESRDIR
jgi:hypothetical protein